jgi:hypothetical protein
MPILTFMCMHACMPYVCRSVCLWLLLRLCCVCVASALVLCVYVLCLCESRPGAYEASERRLLGHIYRELPAPGFFIFEVYTCMLQIF